MAPFLAGYGYAFQWHHSWRILDNFVQSAFIKIVSCLCLSSYLEPLFPEPMLYPTMLHTDNKGMFFASNCLSSKFALVFKLFCFIFLHIMTFNILLKFKHVPDITYNMWISSHICSYRGFVSCASVRSGRFLMPQLFMGLDLGIIAINFKKFVVNKIQVEYLQAWSKWCSFGLYFNIAFSIVNH